MTTAVGAHPARSLTRWQPDGAGGRREGIPGALGVGPEQTAQAKSSLNLGSLVGLLGALLSSLAGSASDLVFLMALLNLTTAPT